MKFIVLLKALLLDSTNQQQVQEFNQTVEALQELRSGKKKKQKTPEDVNRLLKDFTQNYLKPMRKKLKNFESAK